MVIFLIVFCEIIFWVFVLAGLTARYVLKRKTLSIVLLALTPVVDLVLFAATVLDLRNGAVPTMAHGLSAIYIGVSVAFGKKMIAWADSRFAAKFNDKTTKRKLPKYGKEHAAQERRDWLRHLLAFIIGTILLIIMVLCIDETGETETLLRMIKTWGIVLLIDFIISFSYTLCPRKE